MGAIQTLVPFGTAGDPTGCVLILLGQGANERLRLTFSTSTCITVHTCVLFLHQFYQVSHALNVVLAVNHSLSINGIDCFFSNHPKWKIGLVCLC